jgi:pilus assembly protein CpaE
VTNVLAVAVDSELLDRISAIQEHHLVSIDRENVNRIRERGPDKTFQPDLILVGSSVAADQAIEYARVVLRAYPKIAVVLVAAPDRDLIRKATRVGIRGVIRSSISDRELSGLLTRAGSHVIEDDAIGRRPHQVIVVASPKGGVGKTMTAVNLAALLAESAPGEVALLDLDLQFGDVSAVLDVEPEYTTADAFASGADDSMLLRTLLMPHPAHFYILCGADHPAGVGVVTGDEIRKLVSQFATSFRYVVVDTSGGLQEETLASLEEATDVVFVTALDVATLRAVRKEVDVLAELGLLPQRRHVVLNRADRMFGLTVRDAERILGLPVDAVIPASDLVALAANHGGLAIEATKKNLVRKPLQRLAENVSDLIELNITHKGEELP